jgi:hypothetical protein
MPDVTWIPWPKVPPPKYGFYWVATYDDCVFYADWRLSRLEGHVWVDHWGRVILGVSHYATITYPEPPEEA